MSILLCLQIGLINLENEDFVKKIVEQTHQSFQVCDFAVGIVIVLVKCSKNFFILRHF